MIFIGDVHGKVTPYLDILARAGDQPTVQLGDFGYGFLAVQTEDRVRAEQTVLDRFIRGNHDDPARCRAQPSYIEDGTFDPEYDILFAGGAWSIDYLWRTPGVSWWADEEMSITALEALIDAAQALRPKILATHDCPAPVAKALFPERTRVQYPTRTGQALAALFEVYQPDLWVFGHWHESARRKINGTEFVCLNELETMTI